MANDKQARSNVETFYALPKIIDGGVAGIVGVSCVFPIDLVKTRLQNQQVGPKGELMYSSLWDCAKKTFRKEGFFGCYRGAGVNLLLITPEKAIKLVGNDFYRYHLRDKNNNLTIPREMVAGGLAGFSQIIVTTPMELLKIQMQDAGRKESKGGPRMTATMFARELMRERGIFGLYRGFGSTALRDVAFSMVYFPMFANLNALGKRRPGSNEAVAYVSFLAGIAAASTGSFVVTPFDVIKTRLQTIEKRAGEKEYKGIMDCFIRTLRDEGYKAFFKGGFCRVLVTAPLFGIAQTVYYIGVGNFFVGHVAPSYVAPHARPKSKGNDSSKN